MFGVVPSNSRISRYHSDLMVFSTLLARRLTLVRWKSPAPPSHSHWIREVMLFLKLEKSQRYSSKRFLKNLAPFSRPLWKHISCSLVVHHISTLPPHNPIFALSFHLYYLGYLQVFILLPVQIQSNSCAKYVRCVGYWSNVQHIYNGAPLLPFTVLIFFFVICCSHLA